MQPFYYKRKFLCNIELLIFYQLICFHNYEHYYVTACQHIQASVKPSKVPAYPKLSVTKKQRSPNRGLEHCKEMVLPMYIQQLAPLNSKWKAGCHSGSQTQSNSDGTLCETRPCRSTSCDVISVSPFLLTAVISRFIRLFNLIW